MHKIRLAALFGLDTLEDAMKRMRLPVLATVAACGLLGACTPEQEMAIQNPEAGLLRLGDRTVGAFQSPTGQITITENAIDGNGRLSFFMRDGSPETGVIGPLRRGNLLGPWNFHGETDAVVEGTIPGCPVQAIFIGVTYNHVQVTHIPQCGQFRFQPVSNGVLAIQQGAANPAVFLFQSSQMQGPELYSQFIGQRPTTAQSPYPQRALRTPPSQDADTEPHEALPPLDDTRGMPAAAFDQEGTDHSVPLPSLNLTSNN